MRTFNLVHCRNPKWDDAEKTTISCMVVFDKNSMISHEIPFLAHKNDVEAHGRDIFERCAKGEFGPIKPYAAPEEK